MPNIGRKPQFLDKTVLLSLLSAQNAKIKPRCGRGLGNICNSKQD
jgi:hypothetical protein